jgi:outer membrane protein OmpA-like peptidoglycan-associated protein
MSTYTTIVFNKNQDTIPPGEMRQIEQMASRVVHGRASRVRLIGHTDPLRTPDVSKQVSEEMALNVAKAFVDQGVPRNIIDVFGDGAAHPLPQMGNFKPDNWYVGVEVHYGR